LVFKLILVKADRGQREPRGLRPLQLPEAGPGAGDHQGVPATVFTTLL